MKNFCQILSDAKFFRTLRNKNYSNIIVRKKVKVGFKLRYWLVRHAFFQLCDSIKWKLNNFLMFRKIFFTFPHVLNVYLIYWYSKNKFDKVWPNNKLVRFLNLKLLTVQIPIFKLLKSTKIDFSTMNQNTVGWLMYILQDMITMQLQINRILHCF